jgi:hypothetical protein
MALIQLGAGDISCALQNAKMLIEAGFDDKTDPAIKPLISGLTMAAIALAAEFAKRGADYDTISKTFGVPQ